MLLFLYSFIFLFFALYLSTINMGHMFTILDKKRYLEQLFRENYTRLFYHAFSFLNDEEEAKDVVNDVFERVWMNFEKLEFSSSLVPLLYTLVRNRCVSLIRHKKVKERFSREIEVELEDHEEESVEYEMQIEKLRHLIELLPAQTKNVFKKCFLEGKKYQEAADDLGISINTVKTHVNKALRILREEFTEDYILLFILFR